MGERGSSSLLGRIHRARDRGLGALPAVHAGREQGELRGPVLAGRRRGHPAHLVDFTRREPLPVLSIVISVIAVIVVGAGFLWSAAEFGWSFKSGVVTKRWYEERREWDTSDPVYRTECHSTGSGKNQTTTCSQVLSYFQTNHHVDDEDFMVTVHGCQENRPDKCRDEDWRLTSEWWASVAIGDTIKRS